MVQAELFTGFRENEIECWF